MFKKTKTLNWIMLQFWRLGIYFGRTKSQQKTVYIGFGTVRDCQTKLILSIGLYFYFITFFIQIKGCEQ